MIRFLIPGLLSVLLLSSQAQAVGKFDFLGGFMTLSAKNDRGQGAISGLGSYVATYNYNFFDRVDFSVGYSLFFTKIISGDIGYGPDLGFTYFPFTSSSPIQIQTDRVLMVYRDTLRPFLNFSFHQRQYQSVEAAYAGFGLGLGAEYHWNSKFDLKGLFRYQLLTGPQQSTGNYMDFLLGVSFGI